MKQIFDWLREQIEEKSVEVNNVAVVNLHNAIVSVNRAQLKWESECCEWYFLKYTDLSFTKNHPFMISKETINSYSYCPYCGKRIKILEVE